MDGRDFRSIGRAAQEELRRRAVYLVEHEGLTQAEAARVVGVERQAVNIWLKRHRGQGEDGLLDGRRVSPRRGKGLLTAAEARKVQSWIRDKTPDQLMHRSTKGDASLCALDLSGGARSDRAAL